MQNRHGILITTPELEVIRCALQSRLPWLSSHAAVSAGSVSSEPLRVLLAQNAVVFQTYGMAGRWLSQDSTHRGPLTYSQVFLAGDRRTLHDCSQTAIRFQGLPLEDCSGTLGPWQDGHTLKPNLQSIFLLAPLSLAKGSRTHV